MASPKDKLAQLLLSGQYSDLTLVCGGQEFKVHKNIVCTQSTVIHRMMKGKFKEAKTNRVEVDFAPEVLKCMLDFMYTSDYNMKPAPAKKETQQAGAQSPADIQTEPVHPSVDDILLYHVDVNSIAEYYDVMDLASLSANRACEFLQTNWSTKAFCNLIQKVEDSTRDRHIRKRLAQIAANNIVELLKQDAFAEGKIANDMAAEVLRAAECVFAQIQSERLQHAKALQAERDKILLLKENIQEITDVMTTRECKVKFGVTLQPPSENTEQRYLVRCATCGCRHVWDKKYKTASLAAPPTRI